MGISSGEADALQVIATITSLLSLCGSSYMIGDFAQRYLDVAKKSSVRMQDEVR